MKKLIFLFILAEQWKLLGQEKDGSILIGWTEKKVINDRCVLCTVIGNYDQNNNKLQVKIIKIYNVFFFFIQIYLIIFNFILIMDLDIISFFGSIKHCTSYN